MLNIGDKVGRLTVVSNPFKPDPEKYEYRVEVECDCGSPRKTVRKQSLVGKSSVQSCGCLQREFASRLKTQVLGLSFNRLTVTHDLGVDESSRRWVLVSCRCGTASTKFRFDLVQSGHTKSCGCLYLETRNSNLTHGMCDSPEYNTWQGVKERCRNPNTPGYENYGGRGISYDPRWELFENFYEDMGERLEGMTLDRIDVNGKYCLENCRWADKTIQSFNRNKQEGTSSKYIGVYYDTAKDKWVARLYKHKIKVYHGYFLTEISAAKAYDEASLFHYGVRKNFPDQQTE